MHVLARTHTHTHTQNAIHLAIKKNTIFPFAGTWVDLEDIVLNEIAKLLVGLASES